MKNKNLGRLWIATVVLLLCFVLSTVIFTSLLSDILSGERQMISLVPDIALDAGADFDDSGTENVNAVEQNNLSGTVTNYNPVTVYDDKKVWGSKTDVEIFKISYVNDQMQVSVLSEDGQEVIAPGTENEYTFNIKNNSDFPIKYTMQCRVFSKPEGLFFPVEMSLNSYTGDYLFGSDKAMQNIEDIDEVTDTATLSGNNYAYYTLNWRWPFEWDNDEYDTYLGNRAVDEDLTVTVEIKTIAEWDDSDLGDGSGLKTPETGDRSNIILPIILMIGSLISIVFLVLAMIKSRKKSDDDTRE